MGLFNRSLTGAECGRVVCELVVPVVAGGVDGGGGRPVEVVALGTGKGDVVHLEKGT